VNKGIAGLGQTALAHWGVDDRHFKRPSLTLRPASASVPRRSILGRAHFTCVRGARKSRWASLSKPGAEQVPRRARHPSCVTRRPSALKSAPSMARNLHLTRHSPRCSQPAPSDWHQGVSRSAVVFAPVNVNRSQDEPRLAAPRDPPTPAAACHRRSNQLKQRPHARHSK
jgi:hypothetical protein